MHTRYFYTRVKTRGGGGGGVYLRGQIKHARSCAHTRTCTYHRDLREGARKLATRCVNLRGKKKRAISPA